MVILLDLIIKWRMQQERILIVLWSGDATVATHLWKIVRNSCDAVAHPCNILELNVVVLLVVYPFNVVELDAAAATHPHNVELGGNSSAV